MRCKNCNCEIGDDVICRYCGNVVNDNQSQHYSNSTPFHKKFTKHFRLNNVKNNEMMPKEKKIMRIVMIIGIVLGGLQSLLSLWSFKYVIDMGANMLVFAFIGMPMAFVICSISILDLIVYLCLYSKSRKVKFIYVIASLLINICLLFLFISIGDGLFCRTGQKLISVACFLPCIFWIANFFILIAFYIQYKSINKNNKLR